MKGMRIEFIMQLPLLAHNARDGFRLNTASINFVANAVDQESAKCTANVVNIGDGPDELQERKMG